MCYGEEKFILNVYTYLYYCHTVQYIALSQYCVYQVHVILDISMA